MQTGLPGSVVCFGEKENGELMALSLNGLLYEVSIVTPIPVQIISFTANKINASANKISWVTNNESNLSGYSIQQSINGREFTDIAFVNAQNTAQANYSYDHHVAAAVRIYYRLKAIDRDGSFTYSNTTSIAANEKVNPVMVTSVTENAVSLSFNKAIKEVALYDAVGKLLSKEKIETGVTTHTLKVNLSRAVYFIKAMDANDQLSSIKFIY